MSKVSQPKKTDGSTTSTKKAPSKNEDLAVTMTIVEPEQKATASKKTASVESASTETQVSKETTELSFDVIQEQAYFLWEKDGYQHGLDEVHWLKAEALLRQTQEKPNKATTKK